MKTFIRALISCVLLTTALRAQWAPQAIQQFTGTNFLDLFGFSVAGAGDLDGDGVPDYAVGTPGDSSGGIGAGAVHVYSGATGNLIYALMGDSVFTRMGTSVANAGDVNGDGVPDIIAGSGATAQNLSFPGGARIFSGATGALLLTFVGQTPGEEAGHSVAGLGDVNGDGIPDVAVGAPWAGNGGLFHSGAAYILSGGTGEILFSFFGDVAGGHLGDSVAGVGDINGDGVPDFAIGIPFGPNSVVLNGAARVYSGSTGDLLFILGGATTSSIRFGFSVSGAGDVNRDGTPDVIVGAPANLGVGSARVYSGATGALLHTFSGNSTLDPLFGYAVAGAGDVDGDGFDDVIVSNPGDNTMGSNSGGVHVFSGRTGALVFSAFGAEMGEQLGFSVAGVGDVNDDGAADVLAGAPFSFATFFSQVGAARVYSVPPHLAPCAAGNVGEGMGGPYDVLFVNGSSGGLPRIVDVDVGAPFTLAMNPPPTNPFPAPFALGAFIGLPDATDVTPLPFGIGDSCLPATPGYPGYFILTNSFVAPPNGPVTSTPTPWAWSHQGLPFPFTLTLQGVIHGTPSLVQLTNAVALRIR